VILYLQSSADTGLSPSLFFHCSVQERPGMGTRIANPPRTIRHHTTPLPPFIQVGRKPRINSSGGAERTQKPTPHPRDGDCFYLINKTCRTQAQKCRLSTTSTRHSPTPLARRREWVEQEERHNARYQSARRLRFPPATATAGLAIQPKGRWYEKRTCRIFERAANERFISTYCRFVHSASSASPTLRP
jgi:hypothetical protein